MSTRIVGHGVLWRRRLPKQIFVDQLMTGDTEVGPDVYCMQFLKGWQDSSLFTLLAN